MKDNESASCSIHGKFYAGYTECPKCSGKYRIMPSDAMKLHMAREVLNGWAEEEGLFKVYAMEVARAYLDLRKEPTYYISGVVEDKENYCTPVPDSDAQFFTLYRRESDGTSTAVLDGTLLECLVRVRERGLKLESSGAGEASKGAI